MHLRVVLMALAISQSAYAQNRSAAATLRRTEDAIKNQQIQMDRYKEDWDRAKKIPQKISSIPDIKNVDLTNVDQKTTGPVVAYVFKILQVVDDNNAILTIHWPNDAETKDLWLQHSTKGLVDDDMVVLSLPIKVIGTESYETRVGKRTINKITFVTRKDIEDVQTKEAEYRKIPDDDENTIWILRDGTELAGKPVSMKGTTVQFRLTNKKTVKVQSNSLSDYDRKRLAVALQQKPKAKP